MEMQFIRFANHTARIAGKPWTFLLCLGVVIVWAVSGPIFKFSESWQLVINTGTTIVTFLMVFLIQNTQNREGAALQAKLDELIHAVGSADERFVGIERLSEDELQKILEQVQARAERIRGLGLPVIATRRQDEARSGKVAPTKAGGTGKATRKTGVKA